jgi:heat shock protein HtpX
MKRVFLFLLTNIAIMVVLSITASLLGVNRFLVDNGLNLGNLLVFSAIFGFGGSFISLAISKWMAKTSMGVRVIENPQNETERWLVNTVQKYAQASGIKMPEVGIFPSPDVNAFATGMTKDSSLVAVSEGLLQHMTREEASAVIGHEVAHAANGDMVTLSLIQGVVNTFVIFASRVIGYVVDSFLRRGSDSTSPGIGYYVTYMVAEIVFGILASVIVMWFSRRREYAADSGGAKLAGRKNMINALKRLQLIQEKGGALPLPEKMAAFGISGGAMSWFSTHPPLSARIEALEAMNEGIAS